MAGEQKRKAREALLTKALLLGYTFERSEWKDAYGRTISSGYVIKNPNGAISRVANGYHYQTFPSKWLAAKHVLVTLGVGDAKNVR